MFRLMLTSSLCYISQHTRIYANSKHMFIVTYFLVCLLDNVVCESATLSSYIQILDINIRDDPQKGN